MNRFDKIHFSSAASKDRKINDELCLNYAVVNIQVILKISLSAIFNFFFICNDEEEAKKKFKLRKKKNENNMDRKKV